MQVARQVSDEELVREFMDSLPLTLSQRRLHKYRVKLRKLRRLLGRPFSEATREDLRELLRRIEEQPVSEATKMDDRTFVKKFFGWLRGRDFVRDIKVGRWSNRIIPEDVLDPVDVNTMVEACTRIRDRAIVLTLYESGARPQEFLGLKVGSVEFDEYGAVLHLPCGKTGMRRVRVMAAAPLLARYLEQHPFREDPDAPLFCALRRNLGAPLALEGLRKIIRRAAKTAGIKKRVYPYLFRHSRLTGLAEAGVSEPMLKEWAGWTKGSPMPSVYIHFSGRETRRVVAELLGVPEEPEEPTVGVLPLKTCPACGRRVEPDRLYCPYCDNPLSGTVGVILAHERVEELKSELEGLRARLMAMEELLRGLTSALLGARGPEAEAARVGAIAALTPPLIDADVLARLPRELIEG